MNNKKEELNEQEIKQVTGGEKPEEFDWREKGYVTPIKDDSSDGNSWKFSAIGNTVGQYFKIIKEGVEHIIRPRDKK